VKWFFSQGCHLVILACNTASAKALRTIQQNDLPGIDKEKRVLGVIRPTTEVIGSLSESKHVGILGTTGTVSSNSYVLEIQKFYPGLKVYQQACPMWVPLVENNEYDNHGTDFFIKKYIQQLLGQDEAIDTILLACTHYPLLMDKIKEYSPADMRILSQGEIVAKVLRIIYSVILRSKESAVKIVPGNFIQPILLRILITMLVYFSGKALRSKHLDLDHG
jgi:glutamate racemase